MSASFPWALKRKAKLLRPSHAPPAPTEAGAASPPIRPRLPWPPRPQPLPAGNGWPGSDGDGDGGGGGGGGETDILRTALPRVNVDLKPDVVFRKVSLAPYGTNWASDVVVFLHNAVRREFMDLYALLDLMQRKRRTLTHDLVDVFFEWWTDFETFCVATVNAETEVIFPPLMKRTPLTAPALRDSARMLANGKFVVGLRKVTDFRPNFTPHLPAGEVLPRLISLVSELSFIHDYYASQEAALPPVIAAHFRKRNKASWEKALTDHMRYADSYDMNLVLLTRWLRPSADTKWRLRNLKPSEHLAFGGWRREAERNHLQIVDYFTQSLCDGGAAGGGGGGGGAGVGAGGAAAMDADGTAAGGRPGSTGPDAVAGGLLGRINEARKRRSAASGGAGANGATTAIGVAMAVAPEWRDRLEESKTSTLQLDGRAPSDTPAADGKGGGAAGDGTDGGDDKPTPGGGGKADAPAGDAAGSPASAGPLSGAAAASPPGGGTEPLLSTPSPLPGEPGWATGGRLRIPDIFGTSTLA